MKRSASSRSPVFGSCEKRSKQEGTASSATSIILALESRELPTLSLQGNPCLLDTSVGSATTGVDAVACLSRLGKTSLTHIVLYIPIYPHCTILP